MSEKCDDCNRRYDIVYWVPNEVWAKIAPKKEALGPYPEHQFGGLLCPDCAFRRAQEKEIYLYFNATVGDWQ